MKRFRSLQRAAQNVRAEAYAVDRPIDDWGQYRLELPRDFPFGIKRLTYQPADPMPPLTWHTYLEVFVLLSPRCRMQIGARQIGLAAGDVLVMDNLRLHAVRPLPGTPVDSIVIRFMPEFVLGLAPSTLDNLLLLPFHYETDCPPRVVRSDSPIIAPIHAALENLLRCWASPELRHYWQLGCRLHFMVLLHQLSRDCCSAELIEQSMSRQRKLTGRLRNLFEHIQRNFAERISIAEAAKISGLSKPRFYSVFREATGMTLVRYLNQLRLAHAAALLRETDKSIAEVASDAGFADQSYFDRCFRRHFSMTPLRFRHGADFAANTGGPP